MADPVHQMPTRTLLIGTRLFHGTASAGCVIPDGPAWFCCERFRAQQWAGWRLRLPEGRTLGPERVLTFTLTRTVRLLDLSSRSHWSQLGELLVGDPDPSPWQLAGALVGRADGWWTSAEVLLCRPAEVLEPAG